MTDSTDTDIVLQLPPGAMEILMAAGADDDGLHAAIVGILSTIAWIAVSVHESQPAVYPEYAALITKNLDRVREIVTSPSPKDALNALLSELRADYVAPPTRRTP